VSWVQPAKHESEGQKNFVTIFNVVEVDMQRKDTTFLFKFAKQIKQHIHWGIEDSRTEMLRKASYKLFSDVRFLPCSLVHSISPRTPRCQEAKAMEIIGHCIMALIKTGTDAIAPGRHVRSQIMLIPDVQLKNVFLLSEYCILTFKHTHTYVYTQYIYIYTYIYIHYNIYRYIYTIIYIII